MNRFCKTVWLCISLLLSSAVTSVNAEEVKRELSPTLKLIIAAASYNLEEMTGAINEGADVNASVCVTLGRIYPDEQRICRGVYYSYPLLWGLELYYSDRKTVTKLDGSPAFPEITAEKLIAAEKLLASKGATASAPTCHSGSIGCIFRIFTDKRTGTLPEREAERALLFVNSGYILDAGELAYLQSESDRTPQNEELNIFLHAYAIRNEVKDPLSNARCKIELEKASTVATVKEYISQHSKATTDGCNLQIAANAKLASLIEQDRMRIVEEQQRAAQEKKERAIERQRIAQEQKEKAQEQRKIETFRKNILEGTESNCGPVIEAKGKMIKIYFPVENYGNEHWIRREQLFPAGYRCRFVNGQYVQPNY